MRRSARRATDERLVEEPVVINAPLADNPAFWMALGRGDRRAAVDLVLREHDAGRDTAELMIDVCAAQDRVGQCWQRGEWSIAQEHAATAISEDIIAALAVRVDVRPDRGLAVVACPMGEFHSLPARVLAEVLRLSGWRVHYLGASLPPDQMSLLVEDLGPDVVALSCSVATSLPGLRDMISVIRETGTPVLVGGPGCGPQGRWALRLGATAWAPDATSALTWLERHDWPRFVSTPRPRLPDQEAQVLLESVDRVATAAMEQLRRRFEPMRSYSPRQVRSTEEDLRHIVRFLSAALLVDDPALFREFLRWLDEVLEARHVPREALLLGLDCLDVPVGRATRFLRDEREALADA